MDRCIAFAPKLLPREEPFVAEGRSCPGCGQALAVRLIGKAFGHSRRFPFGAGAPAVEVSCLPHARWQVFPDSSVSTAQQKRREARRRPAAVVAESGAFHSLLPAFETAARTGGKMFVVCLFNEAGIERRIDGHGASSCPDTTKGFVERLEHINGILETVRRLKLPFMATATAAHPFDFIEKVCRAADCPGPAFLGVLTACPTGCRYHPAHARHALRLAVSSGFFPLYTCADGRVTQVAPARRPVEHYLKLHHAFLYTSRDDIAAIQQHVDACARLLLSEVNEHTP